MNNRSGDETRPWGLAGLVVECVARVGNGSHLILQHRLGARRAVYPELTVVHLQDQIKRLSRTPVLLALLQCPMIETAPTKLV